MESDTRKSAVNMSELQMEAYAEEQRMNTTEGKEVALVAVGPRMVPVKHCNHCNKDHHTEERCFIKYPHLKKRKRNGGGRRGGKRGEEEKRRDTDSDSDGPPIAMMAHRPIAHYRGSLKSRNRVASGHSYNEPHIAMPCFSASSTLDLRKEWIVDTGYSQHTTHLRSHFINYTAFHTQQKPIQGIAGSQVALEGKGTVRIICLVKGKRMTLHLSNVIYCPGLGANPISVSQIVTNGQTINVIPTGLTIHHKQATLNASLKGGIYHLDLAESPSDSE
jgi:hypothetical protein